MIFDKTISFGSIITFVSVVFSAGMIKSQIDGLSKAHIELEAKVAAMDDRGTRWSHERIVMETQQLKDTQSRLSLLEASNNIVAPMLARMDERLKSIAKAQGVKDP